MKCNKKKLQVFSLQKQPLQYFLSFALFWTSKMECTLMLARWARFFSIEEKMQYSPWLIIWRATYFFFIIFFGGCPWPFFIDSNLPRLFGHFSLSKYTRGQSHAYFMRMFSQTFPPSLLSTFDYLFFFNSIDLKFRFVTCQFCVRKDKKIFRVKFWMLGSFLYTSKSIKPKKQNHHHRL